MTPSLATPVTAAAEQAWNEVSVGGSVLAPRLAFWSGQPPAVVLGCSTRLDDGLRASARSAGVDVVRRRSGGGAVLVGPWSLGVSVALPPDHPLVTAGIVESYRWLGEAHAAALRGIGIAAAAAMPPVTARRGGSGSDDDLGWACFGALSAWEVAVGRSRKIVGLAGVRRRGAVLLVASLLLADPDWTVLCRACGRSPAAAAALYGRTTSCARELGRSVGAAEVRAALEPRLREALAASS